MVKEKKVFEFGVWRKVTKLNEVDRNATAVQMGVRVCSGPEFSSSCDPETAKVLVVKLYVVIVLARLAGWTKFSVTLVTLGSLIVQLKIIKKLLPNFFGII